MSKSNVKIVREYIEEVNNRKNFDVVFDYCDKNCMIHVSPYVGFGINTDDTSGNRVVILKVALRSPAHGHLHAGDELVRVHDDENHWETFEQLKSGLWGQGVVGTSVTFTVRRGGNILTIPLTRARIEGFDQKLADMIDIWRTNTLKDWPDLKTNIDMIFGDGDLVMCYGVNQGTNTEYHRSAVWAEMDLFRLKDGKITEIWGVQDDIAVMKQLGYQIHEPVKELVP